ncbi:hypothetical protein ABZT47_33840 [Sphaerisporangium sp. NPDC005289]|uniref:hypothetical protein n=1 Tax=Sphaerisporangium sp. NPDC005289 TaxID=3155247 RepID=UPI0033A5EBA5
MIDKRLRVVLSAGVLGVALAATLTAAANADNASGDDPVVLHATRVCGHTMTLVRKDGKVYLDDGTGLKELKPGDAAPAAPAVPALPPTGQTPETATPPHGDAPETATPPDGDAPEKGAPPDGDAPEKGAPPAGDAPEGATTAPVVPDGGGTPLATPDATRTLTTVPDGESVPPAARAPEPGEKAEILRAEKDTRVSGTAPDGDGKGAGTLTCAVPAQAREDRQDGGARETRQTHEDRQEEQAE